MTQAYPGGDIAQPEQKDRHAMGIRPLYIQEDVPAWTVVVDPFLKIEANRQ